MKTLSEKTDNFIVAILSATALAFIAMCTIFCILLVKNGEGGKPFFASEVAVFLAFLGLAFGIAVGSPFLLTREKVKRTLNNYVKNEYRLDILTAAEEVSKLDAHLSRITAFQLLEKGYFYWAIGWAFRSLKRYAELDENYESIYGEFPRFIFKEIIIKAFERAETQKDGAEERFQDNSLYSSDKNMDEAFRIKLRAVKDYVDFKYIIKGSVPNADAQRNQNTTYGKLLAQTEGFMRTLLLELYKKTEDYECDIDKKIFEMSRYKGELNELRSFFYRQIWNRLDFTAVTEDAEFQKYAKRIRKEFRIKQKK